MSQKRRKSKHFDSKQRFSYHHYHHHDYYDCDPWLSRAAREILHQHLSKWWLFQSNNSINYQQKEHKSNVWGYLDALLLSNTSRNITTHNNTSSSNHHHHHPLVQCPLFGIDVLRQQEENSLQIPSQQISFVSALPYTTIEENNNNNKGNQFWYQCNLCQKTFLTRFYLDRHMYNYHKDLLDIPIDEQQQQRRRRRRICPAQHWCRFLIDCYDVAVEMEPYYSPGSGGWNNYDRQSVAANVRKRIPSCREIVLQETLQECRNMVMICFSQNIPLQEYLLKQLCPPQTCHDRLHRIILQSTGLLLSSSSSLTTNNHAINWKVEKMKQTITYDWKRGQHGVIGLLFLLLFFLLLLGLFGYLRSGEYTTRHSSSFQTKPRSRLLQKPRHGVSKRKRYFGNNPKEKQS